MRVKNNSNANIIYSGNTGVKDAIVKFTVTQDKYKTKTLKYTCPTIKKGYVKTAGRTYRFKKVASTHTAKLKKKIKRNQKMTFYGQDAKGNKSLEHRLCVEAELRLNLFLLIVIFSYGPL